MTIIPQVNAQGLVNLQLKAEVSALGDNIPVGDVGETFPTFNTQDAETTAVVLDGETLVIGGLIGEQQNQNSILEFLISWIFPSSAVFLAQQTIPSIALS